MKFRKLTTESFETELKEDYSLSVGDKIKHRTYGVGTVTKIGDSGTIYCDFNGKQRIWSKDAVNKGYIARVDQDYNPIDFGYIPTKSFGREDDIDFSLLNRYSKEKYNK